jgi:hypothetical protein
MSLDIFPDYMLIDSSYLVETFLSIVFVLMSLCYDE